MFQFGVCVEIFQSEKAEFHCLQNWLHLIFDNIDNIELCDYFV